MCKSLDLGFVSLCSTQVTMWDEQIPTALACRLPGFAALAHDTLLRQARAGFTCVRSYHIPVPVGYTSTTSALACSTMPELKGQKAAAKCGV
jgi:hypothetical protein